MPKDRDRLLQALFTDSPEAILVTDNCHRIVDVNPAFTSTFGYTFDELAGERTEVVYADGQMFEQNQRLMLSSNEDSKPSILYTRYQRKNGDLFPARTHTLMLTDAHGETRGTVAVINDLSLVIPSDYRSCLGDLELGQSERALVDALFEKMPGMLHEVDEDMRVLRVSQEWLDRLGFAQKDVIGRCIYDFMEEASVERAKATITELWVVGKRRRVPYTFLTSAGDRVEVELSATLETSSNSRQALVKLEDVTERNQAMAQLEDKNLQLREFARAAAHDLRAPLRHISLFSDILLEDVAEGRTTELVRTIDDIKSSAQRLTDMVQGLLDFSLAAEARVRCERCDLDEVLSATVNSLSQEIEATGGTVTIGDLVSLNCDRRLIERVFENLISNALKYTHADTRPCIEVETWLDGSDVHISVEDNGIGIAPEFRERIFEPLRRLHSADSEYAGCGIGLALCQRIVNAHDGLIWVENGRVGSRFRIRLPDAGCMNTDRSCDVAAIPILKAIS